MVFRRPLLLTTLLLWMVWGLTGFLYGGFQLLATELPKLHNTGNCQSSLLHQTNCEKLWNDDEYLRIALIMLSDLLMVAADLLLVGQLGKLHSLYGLRRNNV